MAPQSRPRLLERRRSRRCARARAVLGLPKRRVGRQSAQRCLGSVFFFRYSMAWTSTATASITSMTGSTLNSKNRKHAGEIMNVCWAVRLDEHEVTQTPVAHDAAAEVGDDLSTLLGAGQFLEAVIDHIPAVVFVKDARDFRFILLNRAGEEFLGVSAKPSSADRPRRFPQGGGRSIRRARLRGAEIAACADHRGGAGSHPA